MENTDVQQPMTHSGPHDIKVASIRGEMSEISELGDECGASSADRRVRLFQPDQEGSPRNMDGNVVGNG